MASDIFMSHSSEDRALVDKVCKDLVARGYTLFVDSQVLPKVDPGGHCRSRSARDEKECMLPISSPRNRYLSVDAVGARYFDGFPMHLCIPSDRALSEREGRERIYPIVPLRNRAAYLPRYVPCSSVSAAIALAIDADRAMQTGSSARPQRHARAPMFDYAQQEATAVHGRRLTRDLPMGLIDPTVAVNAFSEIVQAYWRLWGLMPPPHAAKEGQC